MKKIHLEILILMLLSFLVVNPYESVVCENVSIEAFPTNMIDCDLNPIFDVESNEICGEGYSIIVNVDITGEFEYSIDGGFPQPDGVFTNLPEGIFTITITDIFDPTCTITEEVSTSILTTPPTWMNDLIYSTFYPVSPQIDQYIMDGNINYLFTPCNPSTDFSAPIYDCEGNYICDYFLDDCYFGDFQQEYLPCQEYTDTMMIYSSCPGDTVSIDLGYPGFEFLYEIVGQPSNGGAYLEMGQELYYWTFESNIDTIIVAHYSPVGGPVSYINLLMVPDCVDTLECGESNPFEQLDWFQEVYDNSLGVIQFDNQGSPVFLFEYCDSPLDGPDYIIYDCDQNELCITGGFIGPPYCEDLFSNLVFVEDYWPGYTPPDYEPSCLILDCNQMFNTTNELDNCGNCMDVNDPLFNVCLPDNFQYVCSGDSLYLEYGFSGFVGNTSFLATAAFGTIDMGENPSDPSDFTYYPPEDYIGWDSIFVEYRQFGELVWDQVITIDVYECLEQCNIENPFEELDWFQEAYDNSLGVIEYSYLGSSVYLFEYCQMATDGPAFVIVDCSQSQLCSSGGLTPPPYCDELFPYLQYLNNSWPGYTPEDYQPTCFILDCAFMPNGTFENDNCGNCLEPNDPTFDECIPNENQSVCSDDTLELIYPFSSLPVSAGLTADAASGAVVDIIVSSDSTYIVNYFPPQSFVGIDSISVIYYLLAPEWFQTVIVEVIDCDATCTFTNPLPELAWIYDVFEEHGPGPLSLKQYGEQSESIFRFESCVSEYPRDEIYNCEGTLLCDLNSGVGIGCMEFDPFESFTVISEACQILEEIFYDTIFVCDGQTVLENLGDPGLDMFWEIWDYEGTVENQVQLVNDYEVLQITPDVGTEWFRFAVMKYSSFGTGITEIIFFEVIVDQDLDCNENCTIENPFEELDWFQDAYDNSLNVIQYDYLGNSVFLFEYCSSPIDGEDFIIYDCDQNIICANGMISGCTLDDIFSDMTFVSFYWSGYTSSTLALNCLTVDCNFHVEGEAEEDLCGNCLDINDPAYNICVYEISEVVCSSPDSTHYLAVSPLEGLDSPEIFTEPSNGTIELFDFCWPCTDSIEFSYKPDSGFVGMDTMMMVWIDYPNQISHYNQYIFNVIDCSVNCVFINPMDDFPWLYDAVYGNPPYAYQVDQYQIFDSPAFAVSPCFAGFGEDAILYNCEGTEICNITTGEGIACDELSEQTAFNTVFEDCSQVLTSTQVYSGICSDSIFQTDLGYPGFEHMWGIWEPTGGMNGVAQILPDGETLQFIPDSGESLVEFAVIRFSPIGGPLTEIIEYDFTIIDCNDVWPGDVDSDGIANNLDIVYLGMQYGATGPARENASILWEAQAAANWDFSQVNGANVKHADCNGDGVVDVSEKEAILLNYNQTHESGKTSLDGPPVFAQIPATIYAGEEVVIPIVLGNSDEMVQDFYGMAFSLKFNSELVQEGSISFDYNTEFLGSDEEDVIGLDKVFFNEGEIDLAVTKIDHINESGHGTIMKMSLVMIDDIIGKTDQAIPFTINVTDIKALSLSGEEIALRNKDTEAEVYSAIDKLENPVFEIYPNPSSAFVNISSGEYEIESMELMDLNGKVLIEKNGLSDRKHRLDVSGVANGIYLLNVYTATGLDVRKIQILK